MSIIRPEIEQVDRTAGSIRYLQHGWPNDLCRWHSHAACELHLLVETRGKAFVGDYIGDFRPGSFYLTGPNLPHNWISDEVVSQPVEVRDMLVQFYPDELMELGQAFPEFNCLKPMLDMAKSGIEFVGFETRVAAEGFVAIREARGPARILAFLDLLLQVNDHADKVALSVLKLSQPEGSRKQARIGEVIDHIVKNHCDEFSLDAAAEMAGMSATTFNRNFQAVTGNRFTEFVNRVRVGQACSMLYGTDEPISSICYGVGFRNLANFNRQFLKMKAMTPSAYRDYARAELSLQTRSIR